MKELLILGAKIMSKEEIINSLEESITQYKTIQSKDSEASVILYAQMFSMKMLMEHNNMSVHDVMSEMDHTEKMTSIFKQEGKN